MGSIPAAACAAALQAIQGKLANPAQLAAEYDEIRVADAASLKTRAAEQLANDRRNRYFNVIPYDVNRVKLQTGGQDYINASLLSSGPEEQPAWRYIATQGPLPSTFADFWRMVWEQNSGVLIMLTRVTEAGVQKCGEYYPAAVGDSRTFGDLKVALDEARELDEDITVRTMTLTDGATGQGRRVCQYQYHAWPDHGIPQTTRPLRRMAHLLEETKVAANGPAIVHCSAGIGRTGTFCTVDIVLKRLRALGAAADGDAAKRAVAIRDIVLALRQQRVGMVQTPEQYLFCHAAIAEELQEF